MAKRTDESKSIARVNGVDASFLAKYAQEDRSTAGMERYVIVPRAKVIQSLTDTSLREKFPEGTVILRPGDALISQKDDQFFFVPEFFFTEYCKWADRRDKQSNSIVERTFDPTHALAKKAMSNDRLEMYEGNEKKKPQDQMFFRYVEHLNFVGRVYGEHELSGQRVTVSFSRGEFTTGRNFISAIKLRKMEVEGTRVSVPLWSQVWGFKPSYREKGDNKWWGIDFFAPEECLIKPEEAEDFRNGHLELALAHENKLIRVDGDDNDSDVDAGSSKEY